MFMSDVHWGEKRALDLLKWAIDVCEPSCGYWKLYLGLCNTVEPSLQPHKQSPHNKFFFINKYILCWVWWHMFLIPALGRQNLFDLEATLDCIASSKPARIMVRPCLKKTNNNKIYFLCMVFCLCVCVCLVPTMAKKGLQIPWSYRWLWATTWVLIIEPGPLQNQ